MVNALGKKLFAGSAFTDDQHRVGVGGSHQRLLFQFSGRPAVSDNAVQRVSGGTQRHQLLLVSFDLKLEMAQFFCQFNHFANILKHHQAEHGDDAPLSSNGNAVHHDVLAANSLGMVDFGLARAGHDVHPAVFDDFRAVFSDAFFCIEAEKLRIGLI